MSIATVYNVDINIKRATRTVYEAERVAHQPNPEGDDHAYYSRIPPTVQFLLHQQPGDIVLLVSIPRFIVLSLVMAGFVFLLWWSMRGEK